MLTQDLLPQFVGQLIDIFEDFLTEKGITLDNPEIQEAIDEGCDPDELAVIFGSDYGWIQDRLENTITNWQLVAKIVGHHVDCDFDTGTIFATHAVSEKMDTSIIFNQFIFDSLERYIRKDWGDTCAEDAAMNNEALKTGDRIFAVYRLTKPDSFGVTTIWIITEGDRRCTTILFPNEY